jgi:drug/metabolite transporter (DMT)-like permease
MNQTAGRMNDRALAWFLLILLSLIWGSSFILIKRGLAIYSPLELGAIRIVTAGLVLLPVSLSRIGKLPKRSWRMLLLAGFLGSLGPAFLFALAQTHLDSGLTGSLNALTPLFTILIGTWFFGSAFTRRNAVGIAIGFIGTVLLIFAGSDGGISGFNFYALFVVLATILYATNLNIIKGYLGDLKPLTITSVSLLMVLPLALVILASLTEFSTKIIYVEGAWEAFGYISILGVVGTAIALIIFNKTVQISTPLFTSSVTYIIPLIAVMWGLLDGERLMITHYLAMALILVGVFVANRK